MDIVLFIVGTIIIAVGSVYVCMKALKGSKKIPKSCDTSASMDNKTVHTPIIDPESLIDPLL